MTNLTFEIQLLKITKKIYKLKSHLKEQIYLIDQFF